MTDHASQLNVSDLRSQGPSGTANLRLSERPRGQFSLVDGPQALLLEELSVYLEDIAVARRMRSGGRWLIRTGTQAIPADLDPRPL
jgi:hypothetical protein